MTALREPTKEEDELLRLVRAIRATPPAPGSVRPARGSLCDALQSAPQNPDFDLNAWESAWKIIEAELEKDD